MKVWVVISMDMMASGSLSGQVELVTQDKAKAEKLRIKLYEEHGLNKYIKVEEKSVE